MLTNLLAEFFTEEYWRLLIDASLYAVIGFAVVFAGIAFLIFIVWAVGKGMSILNDKKKAVNVQTSIMKEERIEAPVSTENLDEETLAVIMAALMAYYEKNNPKCEFTVKRIKRVRRNDYA